jgi:uncharacterized protein (DUF1697 family)
MESLKLLFESAGFKNVRTVQASGNVVFETKRAELSSLTETIEHTVEKELGRKVCVILRTVKEIRGIVDAQPFGRIKVTPRTKLVLTLLSEKPVAKLKLPYKSPEKDFKILRATKHEVFSVVTIKGNKYPNIAAFLEKTFGKRITSRHWSTILKVIDE